METEKYSASRNIVLQYGTKYKQKRKGCKVINTISAEIQRAEIENDRQFVTALARGLGILSVFENSNIALTHQMICERTKLPKATVSRLIYTLLCTEFLVQDPDGGYRLGMAAIRISATAWAQYDLIRHAQPLMAAFAAEHHVSVNIAKEEGGDMLYLACCRSPARLAVQLMVGSKVPVAQTAIGRAYYAVADDFQRAHLRRHLPPLPGMETAQQLAVLAENEVFYREHGYTLSAGEFSPDILAVAVGVYNRAEQRYTHALNASVPASRWQEEDFVREIVPGLQKLAGEISAA